MNPLIDLVKSIEQHQALDNLFYHTWMRQTLTLNQLKIFTFNYWKWTQSFPGTLGLLINNTPDAKAQAEYAKTLFSEMGNGDATRIHYLLFEAFCDQLARQFNSPDALNMQQLNKQSLLLPATEKMIQWQKNIYQQHYALAAGAQLALEWQAYTMIRKLYEGARNYQSLWQNPDAFHEACEFFYAHLGEAEKEHKEESLLAATWLINNGATYEEVALGFNQMLESLANFWQEIAAAIA